MSADAARESGNRSSKPGLHLHWVESKPGEEARVSRGQFAHSIHRMALDLLESVKSEAEIDHALNLLELCLESYVVRVYETRERALAVLRSRVRNPKRVDDLRHPAKRRDALALLGGSAVGLATAVSKFVALLDDDIGLRDLYTHRLYLSLGLFTGYDIYDPHEALLGLSEDAKGRGDLKELLKREIGEMATTYQTSITTLINAILHVLHAADDGCDQRGDGA